MSLLRSSIARTSSLSAPASGGRTPGFGGGETARKGGGSAVGAKIGNGLTKAGIGPGESFNRLWNTNKIDAKGTNLDSSL